MIGQIENAIIALVKAASDSDVLGYRLKKVDSYSGQFEADEFAQVAAQFPLVLVAYVGEWNDPEDVQGGQRVYPEFAVLCAASNLRNLADARKGAGDKVGAAQIAADIRRLLRRRALDLHIDPIQVTAIKPLVNSTTRNRYASVLAFEVRSGFVEAAGAPVGTIGDFETFFAQWDVPPFSALPHGDPLPRPDEEVDGEQTTLLPTD